MTRTFSPTSIDGKGSAGSPDSTIRSNRFNLWRVHRLRAVTETHHLQHARCLQNRQAMIGVESAEGISWEKGFRYFFDSVRPTLFFRKKRQKLLVTFRAKGAGNVLFVARFDVQRKPWRRVDFGHVRVDRFSCSMPSTAPDRRGANANHQRGKSRPGTAPDICSSREFG